MKDRIAPGAFAGIIAAFVIHMVATKFFRMPGFVVVKPVTALALYGGTSLFGIVTAVVLKLITDNFRTIVDQPEEAEPKREVIYFEVERSSLWERLFHRVK